MFQNINDAVPSKSCYSKVIAMQILKSQKYLTPTKSQITLTLARKYTHVLIKLYKTVDSHEIFVKKKSLSKNSNFEFL